MTPPTEQAIGPLNQATTPLRILVADDDRNDHLLLLMAAEEAGLVADFELVDDGSDLILHLARLSDAEQLPDLIVLDLRMPGFDGHRTLEELAGHPVLSRIPVVVFTSSTREIDATRSFERGARWVVTKPSEFAGMVDFARQLEGWARVSRSVDLRDSSDSSVMAVLRKDSEDEVEDALLVLERENGSAPHA